MFSEARVKNYAYTQLKILIQIRGPDRAGREAPESIGLRSHCGLAIVFFALWAAKGRDSRLLKIVESLGKLGDGEKATNSHQNRPTCYQVSLDVFVNTDVEAEVTIEWHMDGPAQYFAWCRLSDVGRNPERMEDKMRLLWYLNMLFNVVIDVPL